MADETQTTEVQNAENQSEEQLITRAQDALSRCNWVIGECAAQWTERYAKGRTDADFGALIGLSGDQVYQRRRVWESFADVHENYPQLKWSHFYVSLNWDDSAECLEWANEMQATVAEMKAWRRAQHGEDLTVPAAEDEAFSIAPDYITVGAGMVRDPEEYGAGESSPPFTPSGERAETVAAANRESAGSEYTPFSPNARGPAPSDDKTEKSDPTTEQIIKRATTTLERVVEAITPAVIEDFGDVPLDLQQRFLDAVENLQARTAGLS